VVPAIGERALDIIYNDVRFVFFMAEMTIAGVQVLIAVTIYSVWLIRPTRETPYRAASARNLKEEFAVYRLPVWALYAVGAAKILLATALIAGIWMSDLVVPAAYGMAALMVVAVVMHFRVKGDSLMRAVPAAVMLLLSLFVALWHQKAWM
jgi:hypothetical protein